MYYCISYINPFPPQHKPLNPVFVQVFMREKQKQALQVELGEKVLARIIKIQRWIRAKLFKCQFLHLKRCTITIQASA